MKIEYQITTDRLEDMIREQLALVPISQITPIELPNGNLSLDGTELGGTRFRGHLGRPHQLVFSGGERSTHFVMRKLRFEQDIIAHVTPKNTSDSKSKTDVAILEQPMPLVLELDVSMELHARTQASSNNTNMLHITPSAAIVVELVSIVGLPQKDSLDIPSYRVSIPLDANTIAMLLGAHAPVTGAAIVASRHDSLVSIRIQLGQLNAEEQLEWQRFVEGDFAPRLAGRQWAMFAHQPAMTNPFGFESDASIETPQELPLEEFPFLGGIDALWRNAMQQAGIAALMWLTGGEHSAKLLDLRPTRLGASRLEASAPFELMPELLRGRPNIVVMRLS